MEFTTSKEYFYKLQTALFLTLLLPLVLFIALYINADSPLVEKEQSIGIISFLLFLMGLDALIGLILFRIKLKTIRTIGSLRTRLQQYYALTIVRSCINVVACSMPAIAFFLTMNDQLIFIFGATQILLVLLWPRPAKVSRDLRLKGDERDMILSKRQEF